MTQTIALIAHDNKKELMINWASQHRSTLEKCNLIATGTTGRLLNERLGLSVTRYLSGPMGGDQQIGAQIAEGKVNALIFFWDPLEPQPHDPDVKALLRIAVVWNTPMACNVATADLLLASNMPPPTLQTVARDLV